MAATLDDVVAAVNRLREAVGNSSPSSVITQNQYEQIAQSRFGGGGDNDEGGGVFRRIGRGVRSFFGGGGGKGGAGGGAARGAASAARGAGGGLAGAGAGLGAVAGVAGGAVAVAGAMYEAAQRIKEFAHAQEDAMRKLAQFSPSQAAIMAQLDANRAMRNLEQGEATAKSSQRLVDAIDHYEKAITPLETAVENLKNEIAGHLMEGLANVTEGLTKVAGLMEKGGGVGGVINGNPETLGEFLDRISKQEEAKQAAARKRIEAARRINQKGLGQ